MASLYSCRNYRWEILVVFWLKHLLRSDLRLKYFPRGACPHTPLLSAHLHICSSTITRPYQFKIASSGPVYSLHKRRNLCSGFLQLNLFFVALPLLLISCCHHHYVPEGSLHMCARVGMCVCVYVACMCLTGMTPDCSATVSDPSAQWFNCPPTTCINFVN